MGPPDSALHLVSRSCRPWVSFSAQDVRFMVRA